MNDDTKDLLRQGIELAAAKRFEAARSVFERAAAADPRSFEAQMQLGAACVNLGQHKDAIAAFGRALLLRPDSTEARYSLGCAHFLDGNNTEAIKQLNRCEKAGFASVEMYGIMEVIFADARDYTQAIRCANRAIQLEPLNPSPYLDKAQLFLLEGKTREALACLSEVEELLPDAGEPYILQARIYTQTEEFDAALEVIDRATGRFSEDPSVLVEKLRVLNAAKRYSEALALVGTARQLACAAGAEELLREVELLESVAQAGAQDLDASVATLEALVEERPSDAEALFLLSSLCFAAKRFEEAERYGRRLMDLPDAEPRHRAAGIFWNASSLAQLGRTEEAQAAFKLATRTLRQINISNPGLMEVYMYRAMCHKELGEFEKAVALTDHMIAFAPENPSGYAIKAEVLAAQGSEAEAAELRARARELDPKLAL